MRALLSILTLALASCASVDSVDLSKVDQACGRACTQDYSTCNDKWSFTPVMRHNECVGALKACVSTCPSRHS